MSFPREQPASLEWTGRRTDCRWFSGEFTLYDQLLDHSFNFGVIPERYASQNLNGVDTYFGELDERLSSGAHRLTLLPSHGSWSAGQGSGHRCRRLRDGQIVSCYSIETGSVA